MQQEISGFYVKWRRCFLCLCWTHGSQTDFPDGLGKNLSSSHE